MSGPARCLQELRIDVRRIDEEIRTEIIAHAIARQMRQIIGEFRLIATPRKITVGLRKAEFGEAIHALGRGEGFRQKNHIGVARRSEEHTYELQSLMRTSY